MTARPVLAASVSMQWNTEIDRRFDGFVRVRGAREHNLKNVIP